jgi:putative hydrolase of HD superfamily
MLVCDRIFLNLSDADHYRIYKKMISKEIIEKFYVAASMQRWNDHIRISEFTELDKQAHKMIIAYILGKFEEANKGNKFDWIKIIEGGIFEFLQRIVLTDIKPPIFHKIKRRMEGELNELVLKQLSDATKGIDGFHKRFKKYLNDPSEAPYEKRILKAAHYLATSWEFRIIYELSRGIYGIDTTKAEIENEIEEHYDLIGVQKIILGKKSHGFIDLCGQLRFQHRWAHTQRIPRTSVLGHMLIVAMLSYLCTLSLKAKVCKQRLYNNYFAALFHDLPEVLTRDIISPVKKSIEKLDKDIITNIEQELLEERILPLLPKGLYDEMRYFYFKEESFENKITKCNDKNISTEIINKKYNEDKYSPIDGEIIFCCDKLAAYVEAALSLSHGIESRVLKDAKASMQSEFKSKVIGGVNFGHLFEYEYSE